MQEKFNIYLSTKDQIKLEVMTKEVLDNWKDHKQMLKKIHTMEILEVLMEDKVSLHINS